MEKHEHRWSLTGFCIDCGVQDERSSWIDKILNSILGLKRRSNV